MDEQLKTKQIAIIGAGNMGEALIRGLLAASAVPPSKLIASDVSVERLETIVKKYGVRATTDNSSAMRSAQVGILAIKPQEVGKALESFDGAMNADKLLISIAAGVTTTRIERELGFAARIVRVMPNSPAQIGAGAAAIARGAYATEDDLLTTEAVMGALGITVRTEERHLDAVTALSGSGPAYVFMVTEALIRSGIEVGLSETMSRTLAIQTVLGAARLMAESGEDPEILRHRVTSPGGTTAAALRVMDEGGMVEVFVRAIKAAAARSRELSGE